MFTITMHDSRRDTDDEIAERTALSVALRREVLPHDPPLSVEQAIAATRAQPERHRRYSFRARDAAGALVGIGGTTIDPDDTDNPDILWVGLSLLPTVRRQGLGTRLLAELVAVAEEEGKTRLVGHTTEGAAGGVEFATAVGAASKQAVHMNHLPLAEVDRPILERWVAEAATRSAEYELTGWDGPVPDEHMDAGSTSSSS